MIDRLKSALTTRVESSGRPDGGVVIGDSTETEPSRAEDRPDTDRRHVEPTVPSSDPETPAVDIDQVFEILKNQRRRYVLQYLLSIDERVTLGELAEQIAAWEQDKEIRQISSQERKRVYVGLYQCHLPKMDAVDAISYNKPRGKIEAGENIGFFEQYLPSRQSSEEPGTVQSVVTAVKGKLP